MRYNIESKLESFENIILKEKIMFIYYYLHLFFIYSTIITNKIQ